MRKFSSDFLLGAATAAHQVEGNNTNSDCWAMEHMENTCYTEPSLDAVDHYNRYEEDIRLMAKAGLNAYRFSLEWARIEPSEGVCDDQEIEHYRDVIRCCRKYGLEPVVTLHHFSSPIWVIRKGGWEAESIIDDFARYTHYVAAKLGSEMNYVCTINEANIGLQIAAIGERYKRQMMAQMSKNQADAGADSTDGAVQMGINLQKMMDNQKAVLEENKKIFGVEKVDNFTSMRTAEGDILIMRVHQAAKAVLKELCPHLHVGLTLSLHDMQVVEAGGERFAEKEWEEEFTHYLPYIMEDDFLGVQNYTRSLFGADGALPYPDGCEMTQMNYEFYPEALEHIIRKAAASFKGDLIVTENGIAVADDERRVAFIEKALDGVSNCIRDGIPVKGYCYWSLLDNFEWQKGYSMTFGLIAVDRATQTRMPKESLEYLGSWRQ
ncbi:glycoside hydrolase family 1 protein [Anaerobium acetethylicum]|uniref:Beta-glucosidase n=1 Tax=Anaerobium acetethylicum TaxID=1619234 RepID=A0A1D3TSZ6_9FIRM|nr:family 1 glycosylhydrolase [Anaerobium acetethylicum]SCP96971.1 beta-glucosidase [Anaerobium acetethylicum]